MRKSLFVCVFFIGTFFLTFSASAQAYVGLGIKGGFNYANLDIKDVASHYYAGYHAGIFLSVKLSKFAIQPEVIFSKQGADLIIDTNNLHASYDYINVPILVKYYPILGLNIKVGPQVGFVVLANRETQPGVKENYVGNLQVADISIAMGLGWDFPFGLVLDATYNLGISDINKLPGLSSEKNQVFQLSLGFKLLSFGKKN